MEDRIPKSSETKHLLLPFPKVFRVPVSSTPQEIPIYPAIVPESCVGKIILGGVMGSVLGIGLGLFTSMMSGDQSPIQIINGREIPQAPLREQVRAGVKSLFSKTKGWSKQFGILTALFGGVECVIEKYRAKHDVWNPVLSGCVVGATLSAKAGPSAACIGCVGFGGFSFLMDKIMESNH